MLGAEHAARSLVQSGSGLRAGGVPPSLAGPPIPGATMPGGPKGQNRPADVVGNAVHVMKVLTGEIVEEGSPVPARAAGGKIGGRRRAEALSSEERSAIPRKGAATTLEAGKGILTGNVHHAGDG